MYRDSLRNMVRRSLVVSAILALLLPHAAVAQTTYNPCTVPPEIAFSAQPNILLLMDFSGSMQQQSYYSTGGSYSYGSSQVLTDGSSNTSPNSDIYDATNDPASATHPYYFGLFDNNQYYKYDATNGIFYSVGSTPSGGTDNNIGTVSTGLSGALLNWALTSRIDAELKALIGGNSFDARDTNANGILGSTSTFLNCDSDSQYHGDCFLKAQGARRYLLESTNANAKFYIRPATWTSAVSGTSVDYPEDWSSGTATYRNKDLVVSIRGYYNAALNNKSGYFKSSSDKYYFDAWTFTLDQTTNVDISLTVAGSWSSSNASLRVTTTAPPTGSTHPDFTCNSTTCSNKTCCRDDGSPASFQLQLNAGTYYVYAVDLKKNETTGTYTITSNVDLRPVQSYNSLYGSSDPSPTLTTIGSIPYARVRIKTTATALTGVVRDQWTKGRYGFMYYKGDANASGHPDAAFMGKIVVPCGKYTSASEMYDFIRKIQGLQASDETTASNGQPWPYSGTPTGEAFNEVYNYLTQSSSTVNGSDVINKGHVPQDPYYTLVNVNGTMTPKAVSCRSTYVVHMSDGNWYNNSGSTLDPLPKIYQLHTSNLRSELTPQPGQTPITANIFSILAFADAGDCDDCHSCSRCSSCSGKSCTSCSGDACANTCVPLCDYFLGQNSMQWAAMYGGFNPLSGCTPATYPWPQSGTSFNSATTPFCMASCTPSSSISSGGVYNCAGTTAPNRCCAEWNANKDPSRKGMPDNYYYAKNGAQLQTALNNIIANITQQLGSSSAVATVAQQNTEGALVIRGAFEARAPTTDTADANRFLWFGHLESYWPDKNGNYDFQLFTSQADTLCKGIMADSLAAGETNCWDAAISTDPRAGPWPLPSARAVYTSKQDSSGVWRLIQLTDTNIVNNPNTTQLGAADFGINTGNSTTDLASAKALVQWVLGTDQTGYKSRQYGGAGAYWILGDIVYSTPVVIGPPSLAATPSKTKAIINGAEVGVSIPNDTAAAAGFNKFFLDWRNCDPYNTDQTLASGATCPGQHINHRDKVVYVGANDGMMHAFLLSVYDSANDSWAIAPNDYFIADSSCSKGGKNKLSGTCGKPTTPPSGDDSNVKRIEMIGQELWAYIPSNLLDQLQALASSTYGSTSGSGVCQHRFMVDLAEAGWHVFFDNEYNSHSGTSSYWPWHTVLLGGEREGGDTYFALDVTDARHVDPTSLKPAPKLIWEYSVFKDIVTTFDLDAAASAFTAACSQNIHLTPGNISKCVAPTFPTSFWNDTHCDHCADSCISGSVDSCIAVCRAKLKQVLAGSAAGAPWTPWGYGTDMSASTYNALKILPISWSKPYVGRVGLPSGLTLSNCPLNLGTGNEGLCAPSNCNDVNLAVSGVRNLAFIGGGTHIYDSSVITGELLPALSQYPFYVDGFKHALNGTFLLALDVETGMNAFKYIWPAIYGVSKALFPEQKTGCAGTACQKTVPYAMSDPIALDLWDLRNVTQGEDGYADSIYVGDMNGVLYGIKLNLDPLQTASSSNDGIYIDIWRTKPIPVNSTSADPNYRDVLDSDWYRSGRQPLTIQPAASWERFGSNAVRVIMGGGKYDNIPGGMDDRNDLAKMSLYNLKDPIDFTQLGDSSWTITVNDPSTWTWPVTGLRPVFGNPSFGDSRLSGLDIFVRSNCEPTRTTFRCIGATDNTTPRYPGDTGKYSADGGDCSWNAAGPPGTSTSIAHKGCRWTTLSSGVAADDCCEGTCPGTCWSCVYDLMQAGERVIGKPLIAGGIVFFTTFTPSVITGADVCQAGGSGYLYAFDYQCQPWPPNFLPIQDSTLIAEQYQVTVNGQTQTYGVRVNLGSGVPSQPVLDPGGNQVFVQFSTAKMGVYRVNLLDPMNQIQGWREQPAN
jgi:type IV pilus assembly protein PilY1